MPWQTNIVQSWNDLWQTLQQLPRDEQGAPRWAFRGQADSLWDLRSSLARIYPKPPARVSGVRNIEKMLIFDFNSYTYLDPMLASRIAHFTGRRNQDEQSAMWAIMQHYSCPTRLLDWTASAWVALYFAVSEQLEKDGAIYVFPIDPINEQANKLHENMEAALSASGDEVITDAIWPISPRYHTARSAAQQGFHTIPTNPLSDHGCIIQKLADACRVEQDLKKLIVPSILKPECLYQLQSMNITPFALFQGPDGIGRAASERARVRIHLEETAPQAARDAMH
jgi:hypothetical protein